MFLELLNNQNEICYINTDKVLAIVPHHNPDGSTHTRLILAYPENGNRGISTPVKMEELMQLLKLNNVKVLDWVE